MSGPGGGRRKGAAPLNRDRVLAAAVTLADTEGLGAVTMRSLAEALGVRPMSLYHYVRNKEELLDGMVDLVFARIDLPRVGEPWRIEMRRRAVSARQVLTRHPWALALMDTRTAPGPATLRHHDAVIGVLTASGFSAAMTERAYVTIDAYVYGFVLQEASLPLDDQGGTADVAESVMVGFDQERYPHLAAFAVGHLMRADYVFGEHFEPGLDLVLDMVGALLER